VQKGRLVADMIRGQSVEKALNILSFAPQKGADHQEGPRVGDRQRRAQRRRRRDELSVTGILVERAAIIKRFQARAKGRGNRISKPTCHIFVTVGTRRKEREMGQKINRPGSASRSTATGARAGSPAARTSPACSTRT